MKVVPTNERQAVENITVTYPCYGYWFFELTENTSNL
jgi:hypothetical protein